MALDQPTATVIAAIIAGSVALCGTIVTTVLTISANRKKVQRLEVEKEKVKAAKEVILKQIAENSKAILQKIGDDQKILLGRAPSNSKDFVKELECVFESEKEIVTALLESGEGVIAKLMSE